MPTRLIVGMSGATGAIYGIRLLEVLRDLGVESHLVMSQAAEKNIVLETNRRVEDVKALATVVYPFEDISAAISSGSFITAGMVVAPCSIRTLSGIANSYNENLLVRAADVTLKERRRLVLLARETPLHAGHLRLMMQVTEMGGIILPPMPAFYHHPQTIDDIINQTVGKVLDMFGIEHRLFRRWSGQEAAVGVVKGRLVKGKGEAPFFTRLPWVREQFMAKIGFDPYPGTVNLQLDEEGARLMQELAKGEGISIDPPDPQFCQAKCLKVDIQGIPGALLLPLVNDYYEGIVELMAPVCVKEKLGVKEGDWVSFSLTTAVHSGAAPVDVPVRQKKPQAEG